MDKATILSALRMLERADPKRKLFGSNGHQYRLNPPIAIATVEKIEKTHKVSLPEEYKYFVTVVGNGGAGPYYGVFPFGEQDDLRGFCNWNQGSLVGDLSKKFPHSDAWNLPQTFWAEAPDPGPGTPIEEEDRLNEAWDEKLDALYWNPEIMNGAIPICHLGCAIRQWLVINGKQRGFVWHDDRSDNKGVYPVRDLRGSQMTFGEWYMAWLRDPRQAMKLP
jgi:hypothetical protein